MTRPERDWLMDYWSSFNYPPQHPLAKKEAVKRADDILIPIFFVAVLWTTMRCMPLNTLNWEKSTVA